jgi:hypothetical protein
MEAEGFPTMIVNFFRITQPHISHGYQNANLTPPVILYTLNTHKTTDMSQTIHNIKQQCGYCTDDNHMIII